MASLSTINYFISLFCKIGFLLSLATYNLHVEKENNKNYEAMCDINEFISCTKTLTAESSKGFGLVKPFLGEDSPLNVSNSIYGLAFYLIVWFLAKFNGTIPSKLVLLLNVSSNLATVYLASLLYAERIFCPVCVGVYVVNFVNLLLSVAKLSKISKSVVVATTKPKRTKLKKVE